MNKKELFLISIGLFFTVIAWLIADIYHAASTEKIKAKAVGPVLKKYEISTKVLKILQEKEN